MKLYIYDHCPYCVKARMIFGLKKLPIELITLLNDDEMTPVSMIGKKMVPILEKEDRSYLPESMDIVRIIDQQGQARLLHPVPDDNHALKDWLSAIRSPLYPLAMPRWVAAPLEEFSTEGARDYFTRKKEAMIGSFAEHLANSMALKDEANHLLADLSPLITSSKAVHGTLSEDDIHLFAILRSLSIVAGLAYPDEVDGYRQAMAKASGVPLHDNIALE